MTRPKQVAVALWPYIAVVLLALLLWDGASYLLDPPSVPPARFGQTANDPWVELRLVPGGLRTHGAVLIGFASVMLAVLTSRRLGRPQIAALCLLACYALWCTFCMAGAWFGMPDPIWSAPSKWAVLAALTVGLILAPRPETPGRAERA